MLELTCIIIAISCITKLTFKEKTFSVADLYTLYSYKEDIIYLPNK